MSKSSKAIACLMNVMDIKCTCGASLKAIDVIWNKGPYYLLLTAESYNSIDTTYRMALYDTKERKTLEVGSYIGKPVGSYIGKPFGIKELNEYRAFNLSLPKTYQLERETIMQYLKSLTQEELKEYQLIQKAPA